MLGAGVSAFTGAADGALGGAPSSVASESGVDREGSVEGTGSDEFSSEGAREMGVSFMGKLLLGLRNSAPRRTEEMLKLSDAARAALLANGRLQREAEGRSVDFVPVLKLFTADAAATWLLTEIDPDNPDIAFGLVDLGLGCPELGYVSLAELGELRGRLGLSVEVDRYFRTDRPLSAYAAAAREAGRIIT
jgi:hypothetical protein